MSRHDVYSALKLAHAQRLVWCQGVAVPRVPRLSLRTPATVEYAGRGHESITSSQPAGRLRTVLVNLAGR